MLAGGLADSRCCSALYPRMVKRDFAPQGYMCAAAEGPRDGERIRRRTEGTDADDERALTLYRMLAHLGHTERDTAALLKLYER